MGSEALGAHTAKGMKVQLYPMLECREGMQRGDMTSPSDDEIMPGKPPIHCNAGLKA
jgi:hypothetical protein